MSERWVQVSEKVLDQLNRMEKVPKKDRLELVRSMRFVLRALEMSLMGWEQWVNNPDIMVKFTHKDLEKMNTRLAELTRSFIEYDIEATRLGSKKGLKPVKKAKKRGKSKTRTSYVA
ncbi:MAG: DUF2153 family protein [Candidatus Bathyarchaeota archaeon]|nr:DUF2153 family protein [Candidatus Bathyarchaeota archaeon]